MKVALAVVHIPHARRVHELGRTRSLCPSEARESATRVSVAYMCPLRSLIEDGVRGFRDSVERCAHAPRASLDLAAISACAALEALVLAEITPFTPSNDRK